MYSRYTPNGVGGFDRRMMPDPPPPPARGPGPPGIGANIPPPEPDVGIGAVSGPGSVPFPNPAPGGRPNPPPGMGAPPPYGPPPGLLFGPQGLLSRLLPRGLDAEDLLVLAVLLLSMKQDGATGTELLIAAGLYFLLE